MSRQFNELVVAQGGVRVPSGAGAGKLAKSDGSGNVSWLTMPATWNTIHSSPGNQSLPSAQAANAVPYVLNAAGASGILVGATNSAFVPFYLDPADYPAGPSGATPLIRLKAWLFTNGVAQTCTATIGLHPVATWSNPGTTQQNPATVSAATVSCAFVAQGTNVEPPVNSSTANFPTAGYFLFGCIISGAAVATNGPIVFGCRLQVQQA